MRSPLKKILILAAASVLTLLILDRLVLDLEGLRSADALHPAHRFTEAGMFSSFDDPLRHFTLRPSVTLEIDGRTYRHNSLGLRDDEVTRPKPEGTFRILVIGDSYTYGWGVDQDETIPEQLRDNLERRYPGVVYDVLNAGVPAYDTAAEYGHLGALAPRVEPDLVVLVFQTNDITEVDHFYLDDLKTFYACDLPLPRRAKAWLKHSPVYHLVRRAYTNLKTRLGFEWFGEKEWGTTRAYLGLFATYCREHSLPLIIVNLPHLQIAGSLHFTADYEAQHPGFSRQSRWVNEAARDLGVPCVDLLPTLQQRVRVEKQPVETLYVAAGPPPDHHLNAEGCRLVARITAAALDDAGLALPR
ncbi:MAG: GDSL-type esterase/lipase family protein [Planctomycetota bacterium]